MRKPRPPGFDSRTEREEAAARRLAALAADLGHRVDGAVPAPAGRLTTASAAAAEGEQWPAPDHWPGAEPGPERREEPDPTPGGAGTFPPPGRHADRRRLHGPRLPGIGTAHVALLAVLVAVAVAGTAWWLLTDRATPTEPTTSTAAEPVVPLSTAPGSTDDEAGGSDGGGGAGGTDEQVTVDVAGKVRRPGIVVLDEGARVVDAVEAAGGPRRGVKTAGLNLARVLTDGEQIVVGRPAAAVGPPASPGAERPVNLNLAQQAELEELPGVGPVTAAAIIAWREEHGGFRSVDQLIDVSGIGEKTLAEIAPRVTV
ncbi:helix-hairpin-helix domain-containing protein [Nocardioides panacisoli]|uniref:helix-hairpin-helix domain-containing protein n=1 Tax=Nocardioides panacisoli TaxID=627624 RepID=UPI001F17110B|nr:helix-hairpin-helix domain-containing protein [Nocardioides panacisoli]